MQFKIQNSKFKISALARKPVVADLAVTFGGRVLQMALALLGNIISARALGPEDFGRFGLVIATVSICGTMADAGLTYSAVKSIAQYTARSSPRAYAIGSTYLLMRVLSGAVVAMLGIALSEPLARLALGYGELTPYLQLSFVTLLGLSISSYPGTILVGLARFGRLGLAGVLNAAITLAGIILLLVSGELNLGTLIAWNVVLPIVSTIPAWLLLPGDWLPWRIIRRGEASKPERGVAREMVGFGGWIAFSNLGSIIVAQGDLLLLGRLASPAVVGVYSVALTLAMRLDVLNQSLFTVMMPRASRLRGAGEIRTYSRRVLAGSLLLALLLGVVALAAQPLIALLYGERYTASAGLFLALMVVVLFDLATSSLFLVAFPLNKPRVLALADWLRVGVMGVAGWLLIPVFAAFGAVAARFLARVVGTIGALVALRRAALSTVEGPEPDREVAVEWPL
ncbi:MAG TPA: oligosaccharide flippase family protein [Chloroflexia bacterium]|jgi:O-antigen/teichoic acid export membrane protein